MKTYAKTPIKQLSQALRPRERLQTYGADYIETHELIAIIIRTGTQGKNALDIARQVEEVMKNKQYEGLEIDDLLHIRGISSTKATEIVAAYELGRRIYAAQHATIPSIESPDDCLPYLADIAVARKEHFVALYLNTKHCVINKETISIGTLDSSLVHPREVFEPAYRHSCARIILAHNHPSGDTTPSPEDITITKQLIQAGDLLGIAVIDNIIVGKNGYTALSESGFGVF